MLIEQPSYGLIKDLNFLLMHINFTKCMVKHKSFDHRKNFHGRAVKINN